MSKMNPDVFTISVTLIERELDFGCDSNKRRILEEALVWLQEEWDKNED